MIPVRKRAPGAGTGSYNRVRGAKDEPKLTVLFLGRAWRAGVKGARNGTDVLPLFSLRAPVRLRCEQRLPQSKDGNEQKGTEATEKDDEGRELRVYLSALHFSAVLPAVPQ